MRVALIAITRTDPKDWSDNMRHGWHEIHHIQTPELKDEENCCIAEEVAHRIQEEIDNIWCDLEDDIMIRIYAQCNPAIFVFLAKWYNYKHYVFPIFKDKVFIGWRIYEVPKWMMPLITLSPNIKGMLISDISGLARERQGLRNTRGVNPH